MTVRATICCVVTARWVRPRPTKLMTQCSSVVTRFLKPTRYSRWTNSHAIQATNPVSRIRPICATAAKRLIVAIEPLSR